MGEREDFGAESVVADFNEAPSSERRRNYIIRHWRGELNLPLSYWVNGTLIAGFGMALLAYGLGALEATGLSLSLLSALVIAYLGVSALVWVWAMVGIWRSAGHHADRGHNIVWTGAARIMVAIAVLGATGHVYGYFLQIREHAHLAWGKDTMGAPPAIALDKTGQALSFNGLITVGTARRFEAAIGAAPKLKEVRLSSPGGRILEAQRMAAAIRERGLDTRVEEQCASACTFVLIAGKERTANENAQIGFHQPSFPGLTPEQGAGAAAAMRSAYQRAGIAKDFIERAMTAAPQSMYYPDMREMIDAHVITDAEIVIASSKARMKGNIEAELAAAAASLNRQAPIQIDPMTRLNGATASGATLTYRFSVAADRRRLNLPKVREVLATASRAKVCRDPDTRQAIDGGAAFNYLFSDENGRLLAEVAIARCG